MLDHWVDQSEKGWITPVSRFALLPAVRDHLCPEDRSKELGRFTFNEVAGREDRWTVHNTFTQ